MIIKKLELNNFRQFVDKQEIIFATDNDKNVTFITAQNTTGKTTIIEAFQYLFFGKTNLGEKGIINPTLSSKLKMGEEYEILVKLDLIHKNKNYTLSRKQKIMKYDKAVKSTNDSILSIVYKDENGVTKSVTDEKEFIKEIMPENLFRYFFFEGEDIERLGDNLFAENYNKNAFANAVKNILGFTYLYNLKRDILKVIKLFEEDLADALEDDKDNQNTQIKINEFHKDREKAIDRLKVINEELVKLNEQHSDINKKILEHKSIFEKQKERNALKRQLENKMEQINRMKKIVFSDFSKKCWYLFASKLFNKAMDTLQSENKIDKGIPGLDAKCIEYILEKKECICGSLVKEGFDSYNRLKELLNYVPPVSVGQQIIQFKSKMNDLSKNSNTVIEKIIEEKKQLYDYQLEFNKIDERLLKLDNELIDTDDVSIYAQKQRDIEKDISRKQEELGAVKQTIAQLDQELKSNEKKLKINVDNKRANLISKYIYCAKWCYNTTENTIVDNEKEYKNSLERKINEIFNTIFNVNYSIELLSDYRLIIKDGDTNITDIMKMSGAQSTIIAFAFIGAVIELSKEKIFKHRENDDVEITSEPYPLVLDAPSSNFDKNVIRKFCSTIPKLSHQTIILVKDTDGDYISKELENKIGKKYMFNKVNNYHTEIKEEL